MYVVNAVSLVCGGLMNGPLCARRTDCLSTCLFGRNGIANKTIIVYHMQHKMIGTFFGSILNFFVYFMSKFCYNENDWEVSV